MPPRINRTPDRMMTDGELEIPRTPVRTSAPAVQQPAPASRVNRPLRGNLNPALPDGGDVNGDGVFDARDLAMLPQSMGGTGTRTPAPTPTPTPTSTPTPTPTVTPTPVPVAPTGPTAEQMAADAAREERRVAARDALREWLGTFFDPNSAEFRAAADFVDQQVRTDQSAAAIKLNVRQQKFFQDRFAGNAARRAAGLPEYTPAEYLQAEDSYSQILRRFNLGRLATRQNFTNLISGLVSADELASRVTNVYDRIVNADAPLRAQLQTLKTTAGLSDADLAESLLLGPEAASSLQRRISQAEIRAEAATRGLTSRIGDVELERRGITRQQAAAGFEAVSQELRPLERLSQIYERQQAPGAEQLQTELESEALLGQTSQRRRRLIQQEAAAFSGAAGTTPTLASRARAGQF